MRDIWMLIACTLPLLLIFLLPLFGIRSGNAVFFLIIAMFVLHMLLMSGHDGDHHRGHEEGKKEGSHGHH